MNDAHAIAPSRDWPLLGFRLLLAVLIAAHGWHRLLTHGSPEFGDWLATQGVPLPYVVARAVTWAEVLGSPCLALGLLVRPWALLFMLIYACGLVLVHMPDGWYVVGPGRNGMEYSVLLLGGLALVALRGHAPLRLPWRANGEAGGK